MKNELILWLKATCIFVLVVLIIWGITLAMLLYPRVFLIALIIASIKFVFLSKEEL
jgi:hypothetical protein